MQGKNRLKLNILTIILMSLIFLTTLMMTISLPNFIRGQQNAIDRIISAISVWEFNRKKAPSDPLVLALVGPPGVGKSETGCICSIHLCVILSVLDEMYFSSEYFKTHIGHQLLF